MDRLRQRLDAGRVYRVADVRSDEGFLRVFSHKASKHIACANEENRLHGLPYMEKSRLRTTAR